MKKGDLSCSIPMAKLLAGVPQDAEIGSVAIFVGMKGGGVFMGSQMEADPESMAFMLSAFSEAKRSVIEGIIAEHGMEMLVSVMFFLAVANKETKELDNDPAEVFKRYFVPRQDENE